MTLTTPSVRVTALPQQSQLSLSNKILLYETILQPIWAYGIQLWGTASTSTVKILERFQSKVLHQIVDAPWYVPNTIIRRGSSHANGQGRNPLLQLSLQPPPQCTPKRTPPNPPRAN
jgi:hypothetical protein